MNEQLDAGLAVGLAEVQQERRDERAEEEELRPEEDPHRELAMVHPEGVLVCCGDHVV
jgi:hypothetical protein